MADTAVAITAGTGTNVDTRTESTNGNHRQVVVLGDPATNAGVAPVDATAGLKVDLGADNDVTVSGSVAVTNAGTFAVQVSSAIPAGTNNIGDVDIASIAAGDNNIGNVDIVTLPAIPAGTNNIGDVDVLTVGGQTPAFGAGTRSAATQRVTIATDDVVLASQSGTWNVGTVSTVTTLSTLTGGGIAHDSADSGNPIKVGAKAIAALSGTTLVTAADRADNQADLDGVLLVRTDRALGDVVSGNASNTDGSSTQVLAAGAAGVKHYITDVTISNTSSSNIYVELKDNTTVKWTFPVPANGGVTHSFATPLAGTAATAWNFDPSAATTTVYCSVSGFKSKI